MVEKLQLKLCHKLEVFFKKFLLKNCHLKN